VDDHKILQLFQKRDEQAIAAAIEVYGDYCRAIASGILHNLADVEEALSDAWLQSWNAIPPQTPQHLRLYLGKLVRNRSLSIWRRNNAQCRGGGQVPLALEELSECISGTDSPESQLTTQALAQCVNAFLRTVPIRQRQVFILRYFHLEDTRTIAGRCGMQEGAVRMTLSRLRQKLKKHLTQEGYL